MKKILLVNDCRFERMIMKDMLNDIGYDVHTSDEYDVITKIKELSPRILICNLVMKETRGDILIQKIKDVFPNIMCYISSSNDIKLENYGNNVDGIIKTPTNNETLKRLLSFSSNKITKADKFNNFTNAPQKNIGEELLTRLAERDNVVRHEDSRISPKENIESKNMKIIKYCSYCGEKLEKFNNSFAFCPFCGNKLN